MSLSLSLEADCARDHTQGVFHRLLAITSSGAFRIWQRGDMASAQSASLYNGGLGETPARSRGRAPGRGVRGRSPPEAETLFAFDRSMKAANSPIFLKFVNAENHRYLRCFSKKWSLARCKTSSRINVSYRVFTRSSKRPANV